MADWQEREEEQTEEKPKKYVTRKEFYICFVLLLGFIFFMSLTIKDRIQVENNQLHNAISMAEERISGTIDSIPRNIEQGIEDANNPIRESNMEIIDVDVKARTAIIRMTAAPKEYTDGMTMKFMVTCDGGEAVEVPAKAGVDRTFTAETEVPFCGVAAATVHMRRGDTEYIQSVAGLNIENIVLPYFSGSWSGSVSWQASTDYVTFDGDIWVDVNTPEWLMNRDKGASFDLKNERVEFYIDGKLQKTLPVEVMQEDEYLHSYQAYVREEEKIKLGIGREIEFIFKAEDNNGIKYAFVAERGQWEEGQGYVAEEPVYGVDAFGENGRLTIE